MLFPVFLLLPTANLSWITDNGLRGSACTLHTFPCIPWLLKPQPLQHSLVWTTLSLPPVLGLECSLLTIDFIRTMNYTSGLLGMTGTLFLRVNSTVFFTQLPPTSTCSSTPFQMFVSLKGQLYYLSLLGGPLLLTPSWSRVFCWRNWALSNLSTVFALQGGTAIS